MIHTDEDDEFERLEREIERKKGQPYHYDVFVSTSQRNQVLEEAANVVDHILKEGGGTWGDAIRGLKK
jgi:hypothetical protein